MGCRVKEALGELRAMLDIFQYFNSRKTIAIYVGEAQTQGSHLTDGLHPLKKERLRGVYEPCLAESPVNSGTAGFITAAIRRQCKRLFCGFYKVRAIKAS